MSLTPAQLAWFAIAWFMQGPVTDVDEEGTLRASKRGEREIVLARRLAASGEAVFDALTQPSEILRWMKPTNMSLLTCEVDLRPGGSLRYVFQRPNGKRIEVRGVYQDVDRPRRFAYLESYDFSPLRVHVTTVLDEAKRATVFRQTLRYASQYDRDQDFDGVASSAAEVYEELARYLGAASR